MSSCDTMNACGRATLAQPYIVCRTVPTFQLEEIMGKMKRFLEDMMKDEVEIVPPVVYVLTCESKPVGVYVDQATADFEMHLCIQGDEAELGIKNNYEIKPMTLVTHSLN